MTTSHRRALTAAALATGALLAPAAADARPACGVDTEPCPQTVHHVGTFNGGNAGFVNVRSGPSTDAPLVRRVKSGAEAYITCQTTGSVARGPYGTSNVWARLKNGGYASDTRIHTGSDGRVAPPCPGSTPSPTHPAPANDSFRYDDPGPWRGEAGCSQGHTPGALALKAWIQRKFRNSSSIGGYSCRPNSANPSQTSLHGEGRALDWFANAGNAAQRRSVERFIRRVSARNFKLGRAMGVQELIFNRKIWTASRRAEGWRAYSGPNAHTDHIHIGLNRPGAAKQTSFYR